MTHKSILELGLTAWIFGGCLIIWSTTYPQILIWLLAIPGLMVWWVIARFCAYWIMKVGDE